MQGSAALRVLPRTDQTCVWMDAGVLRFKLCDRDFDCHRCPLHAALQGEPLVSTAALVGCSRGRSPGFPADRLYSSGHTWVARVDADHGLVRVGLDALGASLVGEPRRVRRASAVFRALERGETVCELDLPEGVLAVPTPLAGRVWAWNHAAIDSPGLLAADPYGSGWLVELEPEPEGKPAELFGGLEAARRARLDRARFCRGAALHLLAEPSRAEDLPAERVCVVTDLRSMLGAEAFLSLVRDVIR